MNSLSLKPTSAVNGNEKESKMTLGQQIKTLRNDKAMSQPILAEQIGIEQSYLSKLENDKSIPSNDILRLLLNGLNVTLDELLAPLESDYIHTTLRQIPDVEHWLKTKQQLQRSFSQRMLVASVALIVFGITLFYSGYNALLFPVVEYEYFSEGIVQEGEPYNFFEGGAFAQATVDKHDDVRDMMSQRYNPHIMKLRYREGTSFIRNVEGGIRHYIIRNESEVTRRENALLQIVAVFLLSCGAAGVLLERRFTKLRASS